MAKCSTLEAGSKVKYYFQPLSKGDCNKPPDLTITTSAAVVADGNTASIAVTALGTGANLPPGMWIDLVEALTGKIVPVQLAAAAIAAATSLSVNNVPEALTTGATAILPALLTARESGSLGRSGENEDVSLLENFWANSLTTGASWDVSADGIYSQLDSAYRNCEYCFENGLNGWMRIVFPSPNPLVYSTGAIYEGEVVIESMPLDIPKGIVKANISFKGNGQLYKTEPKVIAAIVP